MKKTNNMTYNVDKLPLEVVAMINLLFKGELEGFEDAYMVEVKINEPLKHIEEGNEFFIIHNGSHQYQSCAQHLWDEEWAVLHKSMFEKTNNIDEDRFKKLLEKYFETGEAFKVEEGDGLSPTRRVMRR